MNNIRELLPIGSIVLLKDGKKRLMISGIKQMKGEEPTSRREYDYMGVLYPEGNLGPKYQYLFDHKDIDRVDFRGFEDEERKIFVDRLAEAYEKRENGAGS